MTEQKIKLRLAYQGTRFSGWQKQKHQPNPTVQGTLEHLLSRVFNEPVKVVGASRTDAGVHAMAQIAHFVAPKPMNKYNLYRSLNAMAPADLVIRDVWLAPPDFHSLASSTGKSYRYIIHNSPQKNPFLQNRTTWVGRPLDINKLNQLTEPLLGTHDFKSFQTSGTDLSSTTRTISKALWQRKSPTRVEFSIQGSGFLKQMVRNIVGTQLDLLNMGETPEMMKEILEARDRKKALTTALPDGLYLMKVHYPRELDIKCRKL